MPVVINLAANLLLGAALVAAVKRSPALERSFVNWVLFLLLAFEGLVFTPIATFVFRFYPQWSLLYLFDPQLYPELTNWIGWLSGVNVLSNFAAALIGYTLARRSLLRQRRVLAWIPGLVAGALVLATAILYGRRVLFVGDYDAFWHGEGRILFASAAGWLGVALYGSMIALVA